MDKAKLFPAWLRYAGIWSLFIPCAIFNGGLRENVLHPLLGNMLALPLSGVFLCLLIGMVTWFFLPAAGKQKKSTFLWVGMFWCLLTVVFETLLGISSGSSVQELLHAYDPTTGNLWLVVVLFTGIAPYRVASLRKLFLEPRQS